jgi:hypothetical protein
MSHAIGAVRFGNGTIRWFDYNGTTDICEPHLVERPDEVRFREMPWRHCTCGRDEPVEIANDYGNGTWWRGRACDPCRTITAGVSWVEEGISAQDGYPPWWPADLR